jgi:hypothetical protein
MGDDVVRMAAGPVIIEGPTECVKSQDCKADRGASHALSSELGGKTSLVPLTAGMSPHRMTGLSSSDREEIDAT